MSDDVSPQVRHDLAVPVTALTATATAKVQQDIKAILGIERTCRVFKVLPAPNVAHLPLQIHTEPLRCQWLIPEPSQIFLCCAPCQVGFFRPNLSFKVVS